MELLKKTKHDFGKMQEVFHIQSMIIMNDRGRLRETINMYNKHEWDLDYLLGKETMFGKWLSPFRRYVAQALEAIKIVRGKKRRDKLNPDFHLVDMFLEFRSKAGERGFLYLSITHDDRRDETNLHVRASKNIEDAGIHEKTKGMLELIRLDNKIKRG